MSYLRFAVFLPVALAVALTLGAGCASKNPADQFVDRPAENIYNTAMDEMARGNFNQAVIEFGEVERQHPYSQWAIKAKLMAAYTLYIQNKYDDAISQLDSFIRLHPGNKDIAYAYYLKALCYYERITDVGRDQRVTEEALRALEEVVRRFPDTEYGKDAKRKAVLARDHLAAKELEIGRYYQRRGDYLAAINRFKTVIANYDGTSQVPEALHRLTECYLALGLVEEAKRSAAVLGYNFSSSSWYRDSYALLRENGDRSVAKAEPENEQTGFLARAWDSLF